MDLDNVNLNICAGALLLLDKCSNFSFLVWFWASSLIFIPGLWKVIEFLWNHICVKFKLLYYSLM